MNNELYRKLTSITLMTIMFAGGMTIAIPGETPTAVAQTNTLSVSASAAGVFGGAQVIEIVIDDPDLDEVGDDRTEGVPDVEVDGDRLTMTQAITGKWYAYVAASAFVESGLEGAQDDTSNRYAVQSGFLSGAPTAVTAPEPAHDWPYVQVFPLDGDVEITANRGDEVITLNYDDHSDIATISVDRNDVPVEGQVHITISDFQLNLDPTADDAWTLNTAGSATYNNVLNETNADAPSSIDLTGTSGKFTTDGQDVGMIVYTNGEADDGIVVVDETGSNTGVFESSDDKDNSEISVKEGASDGDTFTIGYADDDQQVIVNDFSSTLELIADGTWDSGETLTIRLSSENFDLNTLDDEDMLITDDDLAVLEMGEPITLRNVASVSAQQLVDDISVNPKTHVVTLTATTDSTAFDIVLTGDQLDRLKDNTLRHYVHYAKDPDGSTVNGITTDAELEAGSDPIGPESGLSAINVTDTADGRFTLTFDTTTITTTNNTDNTNLQTDLQQVLRLRLRLRRI